MLTTCLHNGSNSHSQRKDILKVLGIYACLHGNTYEYIRNHGQISSTKRLLKWWRLKDMRWRCKCDLHFSRIWIISPIDSISMINLLTFVVSESSTFLYHQTYFLVIFHYFCKIMKPFIIILSGFFPLDFGFYYGYLVCIFMLFYCVFMVLFGFLKLFHVVVSRFTLQIYISCVCVWFWGYLHLRFWVLFFYYNKFWCICLLWDF